MLGRWDATNILDKHRPRSSPTSISTTPNSPDPAGCTSPWKGLHRAAGTTLVLGETDPEVFAHLPDPKPGSALLLGVDISVTRRQALACRSTV